MLGEDDIDVGEWQTFFREDKFDIRRRSYETEDRYRQRLVAAAIAHQTDYRTDAWEPLENWVELCPTGYSNRFNHTSPQFSECYYWTFADLHRHAVRRIMTKVTA